MRRLSIFAAAGIIAAPLVAQAMPMNESMFGSGSGGEARISHNGGTMIEVGDFTSKWTLIIQDEIAYNDNDSIPDRDVDEDNVDMSLTLVRLKIQGDVLGGDWSYYFQNDFVAGEQGDDSRGSELKDAWWQYNSSDMLKARAGQFKIPFGRQELNSDENLQVIHRGLASDFFSPSRNQGAMLHGGIGDSGINYKAGVFNGESDGEGLNRPGVDNKILGAAALSFDIGEYGDRTVEGDHRKGDRDFAMTTGAAVTYGEGTTDIGDAEVDFDNTRANADVGLRVAGISAQAEAYYENVSLGDNDDIDAADGDNFGFYVQGGIPLACDVLELVGQFDWVSFDDEFIGNRTDLLDVGVAGPLDTAQQYSIVLNYYINGHQLKLQGGVIWTVVNYEDDINADGDDDLLDASYIMKISGYI